MEYVHYSVMTQEILEYLVPPQDQKAKMIDCTCGEGGHTFLFLSKYPNLEVVGLDRDREIQKKKQSSVWNPLVTVLPQKKYLV